VVRLAVVLALALGQGSAEKPEWRVELRSSGGFTGRGGGGVVVQADGTVELIAAGPLRGSRVEPGCKVQMPDKITPVADALQRLEPAAWRERYTARGNPDGCCDQFQWDLEVTRAAGNSSAAPLRTSWIGEPAPELPPDLSRLRTALLDIWDAAKPLCGAEVPGW
jgi:hypothetical protein